jgi:TonB family protein
MKYVFACVVVLSFLFKPVAGEAQASNDSILLMAEQMPEYPGGMDSLRMAVAANVVYPKICEDSGIQGRVFVRFAVNEDGSISHVEAIKGPHPLLNAAAVEAVKKLGRFKPGMQQGKPVKVYFSMPVLFKLDEADKRSLFDFYPGGYAAYDSLIEANMRYPAKAKQKGIEATIIVVCKINDQLRLVPERVENSIDSSFDNEALRLLKLIKPFNEKVAQTSYATHELYLKIYFDLPMKGSIANYFAYRKSNTEYYDLGVQYFKQSNYNKALEYFDAALDMYARDAEAYFNRAITKTKLNDSTGACADFVRAYLFGLFDAKKGIEQNCK